MKRLLALFLLLTVLLSVCACHPSETLSTPPAADPSGSTEHSQPEDPTDNSQWKDPTETTGSQPEDPTGTTAASQPEEPVKSIREQIDDDEILSFIYDGRQLYTSVEIDVSKCISLHYYFYNKRTGELTDVLGIPVLHVYDGILNADSRIYYVPYNYPNVIYVTDVDHEVHTLCYRSEIGPITHLATEEESDYILNIVENQKIFSRLNLNTGLKENLFNAFCINKAYFMSGTIAIGDREYSNTVYWEGSLDANDEVDEYLYLTETNEMIEWPFL